MIPVAGETDCWDFSILHFYLILAERDTFTNISLRLRHRALFEKADTNHR